MDFRDLIRTLMRHWTVALATFSLVLLLGAAAALLPAKTYESTATVILDVSPTVTTEVSQQEISFLLPALQAFAQSDRLSTQAAQNVPVQYRDQVTGISASVTASVIRISAVATSPEAAAEWANAVTNELIEERTGVGTFDLVLLDAAVPQPVPIAPSSKPILLAAIVVGLIAAVFAALFADRVLQAFDTRHAVRERLGTTVLGEIPKFSRAERRLPMIELLNSTSSNEIISAFESVRINIEFRLIDRPKHPITVVSLNRHAGKSTVSAGLSCVMARVGRDVVAIEADLRRPTLTEQLETDRGHGLGDVAASGSKDIPLQLTSLAKLSVLSAGLPVGRAADVVGSTIPWIIKELDVPGRHIIVDSPPLIGAPESAIVISQAPNVVLVVSNDQTDLDSLSEAISLIRDAGGVLLGIVLNRVPRRRTRRDSYPEFDQRRNSEPLADPTPAVPSWPDRVA